MRVSPGFIHDGREVLQLDGGAPYAQLPLTGGGQARFGSKTLRFDRRYLRLFGDPGGAVLLGDGTAVTLSLTLPDAWTEGDLRLPVSGEIGRLALRVREEHPGRRLPLALRPSPAVHRFERQLADHVHGLLGRIDRLPGRARYKRVDTYLRLERAWDHIAEQFTRDPGTEELAARAAISRAHFIRLFGAFYGVSPKQRVLALKVAEAKRLLRETRLSVWEVAEASGFGNRCAFQRLFRDRVGLTPGAFRAARGPVPSGRSPETRARDLLGSSAWDSP